MARHSKVFSRLILGVSIMALWLAGASLPAQDVATQAPSLKWIPADAACYNVLLRNREQCEIIFKSKAWAKLTSLPFYQLAKQEFDKNWAKDDNPIRKWYAQPGSAAIVDFLVELGSDEVFAYAGKNSADFVNVIQAVSQATVNSVFTQAIKKVQEGPNAKPSPEEAARDVLRALDAQGDKVKFPDLVIGFRLSKTKPADAAKKLDDLAQNLSNILKKGPPQAQNVLKKLKVNGQNVHALVLDGELVPWALIPFGKIEEKPGEFNKLIAHLKARKLTITLSVRDNYVLATIGEGTAGLEALGKAPLLIDRVELKPLAKAAGKRVTMINYISKDFLTAVAAPNDVNAMMAGVNQLLDQADLPAGQTARIKKDVKDCLTDLKRMSPVIGAQLTVENLTKDGTESYHYNWTTNHGLDGSKPLTLLEHMGGNPLAFVVSNTPVKIANYETCVKWLKVGHEYFEELALPQIPPEGRKVYKQVMKEVAPLLARLDKATGKMLLPSLDGQSGIVLDAKLLSKQWQKEMPKSATALPAPELAVIIGLKDADLFRKAIGEYKDVINELIGVIGKMAPGGAPPELKINDPQAHKGKNGTLYSYPIPDIAGLDKQIVPTAGLSKKVIAFTLSETHANRLLEKTPLQEKDGLVIDAKKPLAMAAYLDWPGVVDAVKPWVDYAFTRYERGDMKPGRVAPFKPAPKKFEEKGPGIQSRERDRERIQAVAFQGPANNPMAMIKEHVEAALQILKVFRGFTSVTYIENNAIVTHTRAVFKDLEK